MSNRFNAVLKATKGDDKLVIKLIKSESDTLTTLVLKRIQERK